MIHVKTNGKSTDSIFLRKALLNSEYGRKVQQNEDNKD